MNEVQLCTNDGVEGRQPSAAQGRAFRICRHVNNLGGNLIRSDRVPPDAHANQAGAGASVAAIQNQVLELKQQQ